jgi:cyclic beta-1,2-glucan synthetase
MQVSPLDNETTGPVWVSNGAYGALLTAGGTGFSVYRDRLLTAWLDDPCEDDLGFTIFVRDLSAGAVWTACGASLPGCDPGVLVADAAGVVLSRRRADISSRLQLSVLQDLPVERRQLTLTNHGTQVRELEITGVLEVVLNDAGAHAGHPAFSKLFVQTHRHPGESLLSATRRPRANGETHIAMALGLSGAPTTEWETDRARFCGRGRRLSQARALHEPLSGTVGNVLDPVLALRTKLRLAPSATLTITFVTAAADEADQLVPHFRAATAADASASAPAASGAAASDAGASDAGAAPRAALAPAHRLNRQSSRPGETPLVRQLLARRFSAAALVGADDAAAVDVAPKRPPAAGDETSDAAHAEDAPHANGAEPPGGAHAPDADGGAGNGFGAFSADGREYCICIARSADGSLCLPPMPWSNVIANERFGLIASEKGSMTSFAGNSQRFRLTPWNNDPIVDPHDEAFYLRDETSGEFWSLLPGPAPAARRYDVAHGFGYSRWQHEHSGLAAKVVVFTPCHDPLRIADIRIRNRGTAARRLSLYVFNRWVLGTTPAQTLGQVRVDTDAPRRAVIARNPAAGPFSDMVAFSAFAGLDPPGVDPAGLDACTDRARFLGVPGSASAPAALVTGGSLSPAAGSDPCAALRIEITIAPGAETSVAALLGAAASYEELDLLLARYREPGAIQRALNAVHAFWESTHSQIQITTPVPAIDLMVNGWLGYQVLVCRLWARSAYYQSGGAFGFRDQLQDSAALVMSCPEMLREHLLRSASHQFAEGDVLHWWHPPEGRGVRTHFADDLVWLPYLTAHYVRVTGDHDVLQVPRSFVSGPELAKNEEDRYFLPGVAHAEGSLYAHCVKALERAMTSGAHGLPLFGGGDWNDGMNRVGREGRGESVWMGFFLYRTLGDFLPLCRHLGDYIRAAQFEAYRTQLLTALNGPGWDGEWYRRGYYDNGEPLGSSASDECRIDALAQAWSVIAEVAAPERASVALDSLEKHLINDDDGLIRLLTPPFVDTPQDPGYIKGYVAGVRENGGQYTHAALWVVRAMAEAGRRSRAAALLERLSPVSHTADAAGVARYQVEPYVIAADVYGVAPHVGRGGWTWYTGSAGWMLRVAIESILGFGIEAGEWLTLAPRIPDEWPGFRLSHRRPDGTRYDIEVENPQRSALKLRSASIDGSEVALVTGGLRIKLEHDRRVHTIRVVLG